MEWRLIRSSHLRQELARQEVSRSSETRTNTVDCTCPDYLKAVVILPPLNRSKSDNTRAPSVMPLLVCTPFAVLRAGDDRMNGFIEYEQEYDETASREKKGWKQRWGHGS